MKIEELEEQVDPHIVYLLKGVYHDRDRNPERLGRYRNALESEAGITEKQKPNYSIVIVFGGALIIWLLKKLIDFVLWGIGLF